MGNKFRIGIIARLKQGDLLDAMTERGWSQSDTARFLGISSSKFGGWINMTNVPKSFTAEMAIKLYELTGKMPEELFPDFVRSEEFRTTEKVRRITFEADPSVMLDQRRMLRLEAPIELTPDSMLDKKIVMEKIREAPNRLSLRQRSVLEESFFENLSFKEIDEKYGYKRGCASKVYHKALRNLRSPEVARQLRELL